MKEGFKISILIIGLFVLLFQNSFACSVITGSDGKKVIVGANEDL